MVRGSRWVWTEGGNEEIFNARDFATLEQELVFASVPYGASNTTFLQLNLHIGEMCFGSRNDTERSYGPRARPHQPQQDLTPGKYTINIEPKKKKKRRHHGGIFGGGGCGGGGGG